MPLQLHKQMHKYSLDKEHQGLLYEKHKHDILFLLLLVLVFQYTFLSPFLDIITAIPNTIKITKNMQYTVNIYLVAPTLRLPFSFLRRIFIINTDPSAVHKV